MPRLMVLVGTLAMAPNSLQDIYDYAHEQDGWRPVKLRPDAVTTTRWDDIARLLRSEEAGGKLLEVGCGSGGFLMAIAENFDELVGIDVSEVAIRTAEKALRQYYPQLTQKVAFEVADADKGLPFDHGLFDVVVLCAVLEHVVDVFGLMGEVKRVCRPGGCVLLTVPNICYLKHVKNLALGRLPVTGGKSWDIQRWQKRGWDGGHLHYFNKTMLDALLRQYELRPEVWTGDGRYAKFRRWCTNLVGNLTVRARRIQTRDFIHAEDICQAIYLAPSAPAPAPDTSTAAGEVFQIAIGVKTRIIHLATMICDLWERCTATGLDIQFDNPRKCEIIQNFSDIENVRGRIKFQPRTQLKTGLARLLPEYFVKEVASQKR